MKESAAIYGIDKKIKFNHHVNHANFSSSSKEWSLDVTANGTTNNVFRAKFLLLCTGYYDYDKPLQPVIPGIEDFRGTVAHPQFWPKDMDYTGKDVVIIGSGATAITLLPSMSDKASHVTILQRSPSYVLSQPSEDVIESIIRKFTWWSKPLEYKLIRWKWVLMPFLFTRFCYTFPQAARKLFGNITQRQLPPTLPRDPHFTPSYNPFEQRVCLCPDADFYKALRSGKASVETGIIEKVMPNSIKLTSGKELHPDIIVTATGLRLRFGGGVQLSVDNSTIDVPEKYIWKGVMVEDVPNAAYVFGYVDASWTLGADATAQMICRMLRQMRKEGVQEIVPRRSEEERKNMKEAPLLRLSSTYITKGRNVLPKAGATGQWRPRSYYYKDLWMAWFGDIKTGMEWIRGV